MKMSRTEASKTQPLCLAHSILEPDQSGVLESRSGLNPLQDDFSELFRVRSIGIRENREASPLGGGGWRLVQNHQWDGTFSSSPTCREVWRRRHVACQVRLAISAR